MKLCKDCRHHDNRMCYRDRRMGISPVDGGPLETAGCYVERVVGSAGMDVCGIEGKYWEPKTEPKNDKPNVWGILAKHTLWGG